MRFPPLKFLMPSGPGTITHPPKKIIEIRFQKVSMAKAVTRTRFLRASVALLLLAGILGLWANDQMPGENMFLVFDVYRHRYGEVEKYEGRGLSQCRWP